ncbi:MAG: heme exporter protein CcmD [Steroidobacteraceae bacterium]|nr:heme exporter protein CcmD [Steroidobacteraceae bacterium]
MSRFLAMGGYAGSVWPSMALTFGIIAWNIIAARRSLRSALAEARRRARIGDDP